MKKSTFILSLFLFFSTQVFAKTGCFIVKEKDHILMQKGNCSKRNAPCSTFKIAISLMGFDSGLLMDEKHPVWKYREEYEPLLPIVLDVWKKPQNPSTWIKNSCLWYSQMITQKLGHQKFKQYLKNFNYGNQDISGDLGKNNGLTHAWLSSSLKISAKEQIAFLEKLIESRLPVSQKAQMFTRNILFIEELSHGWKLYGKTGSGAALRKDGSRDKEKQIGWFIGWLQKDQRRIVFAHYIQDDHKIDAWAGARAKEMAKEKLINLIRGI